MTTFTFIINKLCRPHPHTFKDPALLETAFRRNKATLFVEVASLICMAIYILFTTRSPSPVQIGCFYIVVGIITIFLLFCRSYPNIFKLLYFIVVTAFGPLFNYAYKESVFFNSVGTIILPTWVLIITGNKTFFSIQLIIQNIYLHFLYKPQMSFVLESMSPEAYFKRLCNISTFIIAINAIFILVGEVALEKAHFKILKAENRKVQLERQKTFILSFSHELRNLINSMIGNIRLTMLEGVPKKVEILLRNSEVCGEVLLHLVNNILDTGKVQVGELEINPVFSLVPEIWEKTWGICSQLIKNKGLSGQIRIQKKIPNVLKLDSYRLMQILLNLVGNSLKFTERGSVSIDVQWMEGVESVNEDTFYPRPFSDSDDDAGIFEKTQAMSLFDESCLIVGVDSKMTIQGKAPTPYITNKVGVLKIAVTDSGCGIPEDMIPKLFKKFAQVHEDPSKRKLGTGLGLFITRELIQKMNGDIRVFSKAKKGSSFVVCIPAEPEVRSGYTFGGL